MEKTKENKKEYNQVVIDVTELGLFSGLYDTIWYNSDQDIDEVMELADMIGVDSWDIDVSINCNEYLKAISELYCEMLENELDSIGRFEVKELYSPRWYNYDTDHIVIDWYSNVLTIEEMEERLKELCDDNDDRYSCSIEDKLYDRYHGYELYEDMIRYTYHDKELWFDMDSEDIARVKSDDDKS